MLYHRLTSVDDVVRISYDVRTFLLPVYLRQPDGRDTTAVYQVTKHPACSHTRQLVVVAYQYEPVLWRHGFQHGLHQEKVYH